MPSSLLLSRFIFVLCEIVFLCSVSANPDPKSPLKVRCPPFNSQGARMEATTKYCSCKLNTAGVGRTAVIKCDFEFKEDIILTENLFNFTRWNSTSAYVRMTNCQSVYVTASFLSAWMDSPSSAMDLWHCGHVSLENPPNLLTHQVFKHLKTFIGVGLVDCSITSIPQHFLRDRSRAALRIKDCRIDVIEEGVFHNIEEVRYVVIENSSVGHVKGPISSSGVVKLSKKSIHSWNGFNLINTTIDTIEPFSFNFTHKNDREDFVVRKNVLGELKVGAIGALGDFKVEIANNSFTSLGPKAFKVAVNGPVIFKANTIENFSEDSLKGIECHVSDDFTLGNNTFYVNNPEETMRSLFKIGCGNGQVNSFVSRPANRKQLPQALADQQGHFSAVAVSLTVVLTLLVLAAGVTWLWRKGLIRRYKYRRQDPPLCRDETAEAVDEP